MMLLSSSFSAAEVRFSEYRRSDPWCHDRYVPSADRRTGAAFHPTASAPRATGAPPEQRSDLLRWIVKMAGEWRRVRLNFMTSSVKLDMQQYGYLPVCFSFFFDTFCLTDSWSLFVLKSCWQRWVPQPRMCCFAFLDFFLAMPFGWVLDFLSWASGSSQIRKIVGLCQVAVLHPLSLWHWRVLLNIVIPYPYDCWILSGKIYLSRELASASWSPSCFSKVLEGWNPITWNFIVNYPLCPALFGRESIPPASSASLCFHAKPAWFVPVLGYLWGKLTTTTLHMPWPLALAKSADAASEKRRRTGPRLGTHGGDGWSLSDISSLSVEHLADLISSCVFYVFSCIFWFGLLRYCFSVWGAMPKKAPVISTWNQYHTTFEYIWVPFVSSAPSARECLSWACGFRWILALQPFWLPSFCMTNSISESSNESWSSSSTVTPASAAFLKSWQRWRPGWYSFVFLVNATATTVLFPMEDEDGHEHGGSKYISIQEYRQCFSGMMLASFASGCVAAFLIKRAGASAHVRSASGYAIINWFQSMLACRSLSLDGLGYGFVPGRSPSSFAYVACRGLLYLTALFGMQKLIASRLDLLEQSSNRNYSSGYIRKLLRAQGCGALVTASSLCGTAICFMLCGEGGHACYDHFGYDMFVFFLLGSYVTGNLGCMY